VLSIRTDDASAGLLKATVLERAGDWQNAADLLRPMLDAGNAPPATEQLWAQVQLRQSDPVGAVQTIDHALSRLPPNTPPSTKARPLFVNAKALDKLGDYPGAFSAAEQAKDNSAVPFDVDDFVRGIDASIATFTRERLATLPRARPTEIRHVFIAGMPRSGTTLIEQILDTHPDAAGVGEAWKIDILATRLPATLGVAEPYPACVAALAAEQASRMRRSYEAAQPRHGFGPAALLVNKNRENHLHLGQIAMLFPDARVIVPRCDPRDPAVSCMMSSFPADNLPHLSTLEHIAPAYRQWERLIEHWRSWLDLPMLDVEYEQLVREPETGIRRVSEFAGLPWNDRCSRFWTSGGTVMTLPYDQVSRPPDDTSVGRWKNYGPLLEPFLRARSRPLPGKAC
jgi:hypothetical protein